MCEKFVCHVMSYPSGAICVARSWTPTVTFEFLGIRYVYFHLAPHFPPRAAWRRRGSWIAR